MNNKLDLISKGILQKAHLGVWVLEYTNKTDRKLYADEYICQELLIPVDSTPEQIFKIWEERIYEEDREFVNNQLRGYVRNGKGDDFEYRWIHPTRGIIYLRLGGYRNYDVQDCIRLEGFYQEVTDLAVLKQAKEDVEKEKNNELKVYDRCSRIITGDFSPDESCIKLVQEGCKFYDADRAEIFVYSRDKAFFKCINEWTREDVEGVKSKFSFLPIGIIREKIPKENKTEAIFIDNIAEFCKNSDELAKTAALFKSDNLLVIPLSFDTGLDGFIVIGNVRNNIGNWGLMKNISTFVYGELLYGELGRMEAQKQLVKFDEIFIHMPFIAYLKNSETGKYITVSTQFLETAGLEDSSQAIDKTDYDIFDEKTARKIIQDDKYALSLDRPYVFNETRVDKEGNTSYYQTTKLRFIDSTGRLDVLSMSVDVTDSYLLNEERQSIVEEEMNTSVAANKAKSKFLINMSHDIRIPMDVVNGFTDRALRHKNDPRLMVECLEKIKECNSYMTYIVNGIIDLTSIEAGIMELNEEIASIPEVAKDVVGMLTASAAEKDISIRYDFKNIKEKYTFFDAFKFRQILTNLVSNSVKFTNPGGQVWIRGKQTVSNKAGYSKFIITVEDNGIGMSPSFVKKIFDQFEKERNSTETGLEGTGLGMSIVKSLTDFLKGKIEIQSKVNEGTTVELTFMFKRVESKDIEFNVKRQQELESALEIAKTKRILLVDDNDLNREITLDLLEEMGLTVDTAVNGAVSINMITRKGPDYYDLILMDIQMPVMDGYEATREIRSLYPNANLPIVALSANAFERDIKASLDSGMNDHISKPVEKDKIKQILLKYCK